MDKKSYEYVYQKYIVENRSLKEMCEDLGLKRHQFSYLLSKLGINKNKEKEIKEDWLREQFRTKSAREIAEELGVRDSKIEYWLKKYNIRKPYKYMLDESKIDINDPIFCYFTGLVATDGYVDKKSPRVQVSFKGQGESVLTNLAKYFGYEGDLYRHNGRYTLSLSSPKLIEELAKLGIDRNSNKTFDVVAPSSFTSDDCMRMYVRGIIDGDGNIKWSDKQPSNNGVVRLFCGSLNLVIGLVEILKSKDIDAEIKYHRNKYPGFELRKEPSRKLCEWIYRGYEEYRLEEKFVKVRKAWGDDIVRHSAERGEQG